MMTGKEAIQRLKKQYARQNQFVKDNYDRVSVTLEKGTKSRIIAAGQKPNTLIKQLVMEWLEEHERCV